MAPNPALTMLKMLCELSTVAILMAAGIAPSVAAEAQNHAPAKREPQILPRGTTLMVPGFFRLPHQHPDPLWIDAQRCRLPAWLDDPHLDSRWFAPPSFASQIPWIRGRRYLYPNPGFEMQLHKHWVVELSVLPKVSFSAYVVETPFGSYLPEVGTALGAPGPAPEIVNPFGGVLCWFHEDLLRILPRMPDRELIFPY